MHPSTPVSADAPALVRSIRLHSAVALVVSSMVGSGIFTTTGFQVEALGSALAIYLLWIAGAVLALCGALAYGELGAAMPHAGGEYVYLREAYGRSFAYMSAFVSLTAGFSAPIASALESLVRYAASLLGVQPFDAPICGGVTAGDAVAVALVWLLVAAHARPTRASIAFNDWITLFKVAGIVGIIVAAIGLGSGNAENLLAARGDGAMLGAPTAAALATSLVFVMFCYSGWNAAAYLGGELVTPQRTLPSSLLLGTIVVAGLYLTLNLVYFYGAPMEALAGKVEVGLVAAQGLFGPAGVTATCVVICLSLFGAASAMTVAGPRVYVAAGNDLGIGRQVARRDAAAGIPSLPFVLQGVVASAMVLGGRVDQIQHYAGFTLTLFAALAVLAVIVLRVRRPDMPRPFRAWGYPVTPALFLLASAWMMVWAMRGRPVESMLGLLTVALGGLASLATGRRAGARAERR